MRASLGFKLAVCLALCTVSLQNQSLHLAAAAQSSDVDFSQGLSFYKSQNYAGARTCFERAQKNILRAGRFSSILPIAIWLRARA